MDVVLDRAVRVFSERGYHGASITDLTKSMRVAQGSIYKAFADKKSIFLAALERYRSVRAEKLQKAIGKSGTGLDRLRKALSFYARSSEGDSGRQGCLVVGSAVELSALDKDVALHVSDALERNEALLAKLIQEGKKDGSIHPSVDTQAAARMMLCLVQGMRVVGKVGTQKNMRAMVSVALKTLS
jgi:TetR/AcrR family transcriptional repressor of nem operon